MQPHSCVYPLDMAALTLKQESGCPSSPQSLKYLLSVFLVRLFYKPADCSPPGSPVHAILQVKNTGVGCHFLLQGIFATQDRTCMSCMYSLFTTSQLASPNPVSLIILYKNAGWPPTPKNKPHSVTAPSGSLKEKASETTLKPVHASTQTGNKTFGISIRGTCLGWGLNYTVLHLSTSSPTPTTSTIASRHVFSRGFSRSVWAQSFH